MSYRSNSQPAPAERYWREDAAHDERAGPRRAPIQPEPEYEPRPPRRRPAPPPPPVPVPPPASARGFAAGLTFAGHQVRIGPVAFWICVGTLVIMGGWTIVTATYFAFRDDVLAHLIARQAEMQFAYEDRISEMRAQVDRVTSRQLLDQEQFEQKLDALVRREAALESRATTLGTLADPSTTGSVRPGTRSDAAPAAAPKPMPMGDTTPSPSDRGARLEPRGLSALVARLTGRGSSGGLSATLARIQDSLDRVEARQNNTLNTLEDTYDSRARRVRGVLAELGLNVARPPDAMGGPFVPVRPAADGNGFERQLQRIHLARAALERLSRTLVAVPLRKPVLGDIDLTSGFGVRVDPFLGRPAMHTGLDFRGDPGDPVRVTAAGTVTHAGWSGGYGKMVEVDHGNGLATRYGHLSEIDVTVGQSVRLGQVVGKIGSTGRSTGPHLHYETRTDGDAVDPQKFLRAGAKLGLNS